MVACGSKLSGAYTLDAGALGGMVLNFEGNGKGVMTDPDGKNPYPFSYEEKDKIVRLDLSGKRMTFEIEGGNKLKSGAMTLYKK